jgi:hypothetical protein
MKSISTEDYIKAKETIRQYKDQEVVSVKHTCCVCKTKEIKSLYDSKDMWNEGTVEKITFGYGSKHDMNSFYIAICDECADGLTEATFRTTFL